MRIALTLAAACAASLFGAGLAHAGDLNPDYAQAANGAGRAQSDNLTPGASPIQVPGVQVWHDERDTTVVAHPYLSPWLHDLIPVPAGTGFEVRGAARVTLPGADGAFVVNPNGHCVFGDAGTAPAAPLSAVRVDTPVFDLVIEPTLYR